MVHQSTTNQGFQKSVVWLLLKHLKGLKRLTALEKASVLKAAGGAHSPASQAPRPPRQQGLERSSSARLAAKGLENRQAQRALEKGRGGGGFFVRSMFSCGFVWRIRSGFQGHGFG